MDPFWEVFGDLVRWVPDWQSGFYICILALLLLTRKTRLTLVFLFVSAYLWGIAYLFFQKMDVPRVFHVVYCAAGAIIILGIVIHFVRQKAA